MNPLKIFWKKIFPPYRYKLEREENEKFITAIIQQLPDSLFFLKEEKVAYQVYYFTEWNEIPDFRFIQCSIYPPDNFEKYTDKSKNLRVRGIRIYSKTQKKWLEIELLIKNGHLSGIKISNNNYELTELDLEQITTNQLIQEEYEFPLTNADKFYQSLGVKYQRQIKEHYFTEIELDNQTYYTIVDLEDGNYIGIDKNLVVYSLIHDEKPIAKKLGKTLDEVLKEIELGIFTFTLY